MPAYRFEALDAAGKSASGLLEADNAKAARAQLRQRDLVPLAVSVVTAAAADGASPRFTRRVFSATTLSVWTQQLAGLVGSGLPLERALTALADECEDPRQRELVAHLKSEVNAGSPFARGAVASARASSTMSTARWWPPVNKAARLVRCSKSWRSISKSARRCAPS
jgi:general secretion pathway protein F